MIKKRFSGIGSISNDPPAWTPVPSSPVDVPASVRAEPAYIELFRAAVVRVHLVYSSKRALVSFMAHFDGGLHAAAARSDNKLLQEQSKLSMCLQKRAVGLSVSGADQSAVETALIAWEKSEAMFMDLLDRAVVNSQQELI